MSSIPKTVTGYELDSLPQAPIKEFAEFSRKVAADGAVLLKNEKAVLPIIPNEEIAIFGRAQIEYISSGTGSGGSVHTEYITNILDGVRNCGIKYNNEITKLYSDYVATNPFDYKMLKWNQEVFSHPELKLTESVVANAAKQSQKAVAVINRIGGEGGDFKYEKGAYLLSDSETEMLKAIRKHFDKMALVLNICGIIDMNFIDEIGIDSVLIVWNGGQEGGNAVADLLCGNVTPSGKLTDTIAKSIDDYPSIKQVAITDNSYLENSEYVNPNPNGVCYYLPYTEDIYLGYRYFETFEKDRVLYPFGYGLSYTSFSADYEVKDSGNELQIKATVANTGSFKGAEVVQVYCEAPQGCLGKPLRSLCGYKKTPVLSPGETCEATINVAKNKLASYDDSGATGNKSCYILEKGDYNIYIGNNVRSAEKAFTFTLTDDVVCERLTENCAPTRQFDRIKPKIENGKAIITYEPTPTRTVNNAKKIAALRKQPIPFTGDRGISFADVHDGKNTLDDFIAQFTTEQLIEMLFGEGMCSPKTKSGCVGAFGGVTKTAEKYGIPPICVTDGPTGLRFETGENATLMPSGTLLGCTWNPDEVEQLFTYEALELYAYGVDSLLGPGTNIHRHPLCGRNFEYFSEDPLLSGTIAAAEARGLANTNTTPTIKHFAGNNIEQNKSICNSVISERALREIYLKCYEIPIKDGNTKMVMTGYNIINSYRANSSFDLNTSILRDEWGFDGVVMTDWWSVSNIGNQKTSTAKYAGIVRSQNDLAMVIRNPEEHQAVANDDISEMLESGFITLYDIQRNIKNILSYALGSNAYDRLLKNGYFKGYGLLEKLDELTEYLTVDNPESRKLYTVDDKISIPTAAVLEYTSPLDKLVQLSVTVHSNHGMINNVVSVNGTNGKIATAACEITVIDSEITVDYDPTEICVKTLTLKKEK